MPSEDKLKIISFNAEKKKLFGVERIIYEMDWEANDEYKAHLRRMINAYAKKETLKCLRHLMNHGCNENAESAYKLWVKAGKP